MNTSTICTGSICRFADKTEHKRSAVVLKDGRFLEVKWPGMNAGKKRFFENGDAWSFSFMGEGATLADGIAKGAITVETPKAKASTNMHKMKEVTAEVAAEVPKDIQRLHELSRMFDLRPTLKYTSTSYRNIVDGCYISCREKNYVILSDSNASVHVMDKYGALHRVGFTPYKGGLLAIGTYMDPVTKIHKTAQRFCDISEDFSEDAPLYMLMIPQGCMSKHFTPFFWKYGSQLCP